MRSILSLTSPLPYVGKAATAGKDGKNYMSAQTWGETSDEINPIIGEYSILI